MTDKELLELAAKAADDGIVFYGECLRAQTGCEWNPLTDDGDALRLAVKLQIDLDFYRYKTSAWIKPHDKYLVWDELHKVQNPYEATRRAIVRAAASIGEKL